MQQIVAESMGRGVNTKGVRSAATWQLVEELGSEMHILMDADVSDIERVGGERIAEGVERVRKGDIHIEPGYDGVFGKVSVWREDGAKWMDDGKGFWSDRQDEFPPTTKVFCFPSARNGTGVTTMAISITGEMRQKINNALADGYPCFVGTASADGQAADKHARERGGV